MKKGRLTASSSLEIKGLLDSEVDKMNVGNLSEQDEASLINEIENNRVTSEVDPSLISVLIGDFLLFSIFATSIYMVVIQIFNGITESLLL